MNAALPYLTAIASFASLALWLVTFVRAGRWKDGDDAKALIERVDETENRLTSIEGELKHLATKAEIAAVTSELKAIENNVRLVGDGVRRIESHLMKASA